MHEATKVETGAVRPYRNPWLSGKASNAILSHKAQGQETWSMMKEINRIRIQSMHGCQRRIIALGLPCCTGNPEYARRVRVVQSRAAESSKGSAITIFVASHISFIYNF